MMKISFNNLINIQLLKNGGVILCSSLFIYILLIFFDSSKFDNASRFDIDISIILLVFFAVLVGPLLEEITFRGVFTNNKLLKIIPFLMIPIYVLYSKNLYLLTIVIPYLILTFYQSKINSNKNYLYYLNAIIFSLVHYKIYDFNSIYTIIPMFIQFGMGLILTWIVINFNIFKSIICHSLYNLILMIILIAPLQFPEEKINIIETKNYHFKWKKTPIFNSKMVSIKSPSKHEFYCENININAIISFYNLKKIKVNEENIFYKFKFSIKNKDTIGIELDII